MNSQIRDYSGAISNLYNEMEAIKNIAFKRATPDRIELNNRINTLSADINKLQTEINAEGINGRINTDVLTEQMEALSKTVESLKARLPTVFKAEKTEKHQGFQKIYDAFVDLVVNLINKKVRGYIFSGASITKRNKELPSQIAAAKAKLDGIGNKDFQSQSKLVKELEMNLEKEKSIVIKDENQVIPRDEAIKQLEGKLAVEKQNLEAMPDYKAYADQNLKVKELETKLAKVVFLRNKAVEMKKSFSVLGGESVQMIAADNTKLDGMFLNAQSFRKTLKNAGCELVTLTTTEQIKQKDVIKFNEKKIQMISLPAEKYNTPEGKEVLDALKKLKAYSDDPNEPSAGWSLVRDGDNYLFVRSDDLPVKTNVNNHPVFLYRTEGDFPNVKTIWHLRSESPGIKEKNTSKIDDNLPPSGTLILSSGNAGFYEQHKAEAMSYLFRNMNVVLFNFRGYGESEGDPTEKGLKLDMEAAYQMAKEKSGHQDKKILFKALCMSGGPAAYVAAKHPDTNIFLDQSYSDFKILIKETAYKAAKSAEKYLRDEFGDADPDSIKDRLYEKIRQIIEDVAPHVVDHLGMDFNTAESLALNNGQKAIFYVHDDKLTTFDHVERNLKAIADAGKMDHLLLISSPGEHGSSHLGIQSSPMELGKSRYQKKLESQRELQKEHEKLDIFDKIIEQKNKMAADLQKEGKKDELKILNKEIARLTKENEVRKAELVKKLADVKDDLAALEKLPEDFDTTSYQIDNYLSYVELRRTLNEENNKLYADYKKLEENYEKTTKMLKETGQVTPEILLRIGFKENEDARKEILKQIREIDPQIEVLEENLSIDLGPNPLILKHTAGVQIDHFLDKIGLSDNLIKNDSQLRQTNESPMDRSIKRMNKFINELEEVKKEFNELNFELPPGELKNVTLKDGNYNFTFIEPQEDPRQVKVSELSVSKQWLENVIEHIKKTNTLIEVEKDLKKDLLNAKDEQGNAYQLIDPKDVEKFKGLKENTVKLIQSIEDKIYVDNRNIDLEVEDIERFMNINIYIIENSQNNLQSGVERYKYSFDANEISPSLVNEAENKLTLLNEQIEKLNNQKKLILENELVNAFVKNNDRIDRIDKHLNKLNEVKDKLEKTRESASSAVALPKAIEKSRVTIEEFDRAYTETSYNLKPIIQEVSRGINEFDNKYDQYTDESWNDYFNDLTVTLEQKAAQFKAALEGDQSLEAKYKSSTSDLEAVKGFDEVTEGWKVSVRENYEDKLNVLTQNYNIIKELQKTVDEIKTELNPPMGEPEGGEEGGSEQI